MGPEDPRGLKAGFRIQGLFSVSCKPSEGFKQRRPLYL